jgi:rod shape-determining protein MreD
MPNVIRYLKPDFVTLVLIYWVVFLPNIIGIITAFIIGLYMDLVIGNLLGTMGLALPVVAYLTKLFSNRLLIFRFWQHSLIILMLLGISQMLVLWIYIITGKQPQNFTYWIMSITSVLMWPVVYYCLNYFRLRCRF